VRTPGVEPGGDGPQAALVVCRSEHYRADEVHEPKCGKRIACTNQNDEDDFSQGHLPSRQCWRIWPGTHGDDAPLLWSGADGVRSHGVGPARRAPSVRIMTSRVAEIKSLHAASVRANGRHLAKRGVTESSPRASVPERKPFPWTADDHRNKVGHAYVYGVGASFLHGPIVGPSETGAVAPLPYRHRRRPHDRLSPRITERAPSLQASSPRA
jgi:hypothetical protein